MIVAAFVVSIFAFLASAVSAWYAWKVHGTDAARRHDELVPVLVARFIAVDHNTPIPYPSVRLTNDGPLDLEEYEVTVIPERRERAVEGIFDVAQGGLTTSRGFSSLSRGASHEFEIVTVKQGDDSELDRGGIARFKCVCRANGHKPWEVIVEVSIPRGQPGPMIAWGR